MRVRRPSSPRRRGAGPAVSAASGSPRPSPDPGGGPPGRRIRRAAFLALSAALAALSVRAARPRSDRGAGGGGGAAAAAAPRGVSPRGGARYDDGNGGVGRNTPEQRAYARRLARSRPPPSAGSARASRLDLADGPPLFHRLPDVLLIGAQKAGTTSIANFLADAGVCNAAVEGAEPDFYAKEVQFFNDEVRYRQGLAFYADRYDHCPEDALRMDATPNYLTMVRRIRDAYDEAGGRQADGLKIIVILREPISRELSWYNHLVFQLRKKDPPDYAFMVAKDLDKPGGPDAEAISFGRYVQEQTMALLVGPTASYDTATPPCHQDRYSEFPPCFGLYAHFVEEWFDWFSRKQVLVLSYYELVNDPDKLRWRLKKFLNLDKEMVKDVLFSRNANKHDTNFKIEKPGCQVTEKLKGVFHRHNEELYKLLEERPGMYMEQAPFPRFIDPECTNDA